MKINGKMMIQISPNSLKFYDQYDVISLKRLKVELSQFSSFVLFRKFACYACTRRMLARSGRGAARAVVSEVSQTTPAEIRTTRENP